MWRKPGKNNIRREAQVGASASLDLQLSPNSGRPKLFLMATFEWKKHFVLCQRRSVAPRKLCLSQWGVSQNEGWVPLVAVASGCVVGALRYQHEGGPQAVAFLRSSNWKPPKSKDWLPRNRESDPGKGHNSNSDGVKWITAGEYWDKPPANW